MEYNIPEVGTITIKTIILDLNGTLSVNGKIVDGVEPRIKALKDLGIDIVLFTGDHRGTAKDICDDLGITFKKAASQKEKEALALELEPETTAAIGNARIDIGTFKHVKISVATIQAEGIHTGILEHVDIIVPNINDALDLFLNSKSLEATMRT